MEKTQNILVPTDFSTNSLSALKYASTIAKSYESIIHILHCIEPISGSPSISCDNQTFIQEGIKRVEKEMKEFILSIYKPDLKIREVIRTGKAYDQILSYSRDSEISLIILSIKNGSGNNEIIKGKTVEKVIRYAQVPVILLNNNTLVNYGSCSSEMEKTFNAPGYF